MSAVPTIPTSGLCEENRVATDTSRSVGFPVFDIEFNDPVYTRSARQYDLPIDLTDVLELDGIEHYYPLSGEQKDFLEEHGYVGVGDSGAYDVVTLYKNLKEIGQPIYVTTDSILHLYHVFFDDILMRLEQDQFFNMSKEMTKALLDEAIEQYENASGEFTYVHEYVAQSIYGPVSYTITETINLKETARKNIAFLSVGMKLIDPSASVPTYVQSEVQEELDLIDAHGGFEKSPLYDKSSVHQILTYKEDYSQYKPRGHYTRSDALEKYFREMMWFGRMALRTKSGEETVQAILLADCAYNARWSGGTALSLWDHIYYVTSFFVGNSDDLVIDDYAGLTSEVYGDLSSDFSELLDDGLLDQYIDGLKMLREPRICSNYVRVDLEDVVNASVGLRLMGQRYIPDSYMFQELVFPKVEEYEGTGTPFTMSDIIGYGPGRGFPRGMEVMAVLGSDIAEDYLLRDGDTEYKNYSQQFGRLKKEFSTLGEEAYSQNLYWGWLYTLESLNENFTKDGYPTFMRNRAYLAGKLNTALGSWTELRHDTILYAKQSYTPTMGISEIKGYVEPIPTFWSRLHDLTNATIGGLKSLGVLDELTEEDLNGFKRVLTELGNISAKELASEELSSAEYEYIKRIGFTLEDLLENVPEDSGDSRMVADVHTDPNQDPTDGVTEKCLEEAVGTFELVVVVVDDTDGNLRAAIGPVFSYYEFKQKTSERLTDEEWRAILETGVDVPEKFNWMAYPADLGSISNETYYPDVGLISEDISFSTVVDHPDARINITAVVFNKWREEVTASVSFYLDGVDPEHLLGSQDVRIPALGEVTIAHEWILEDPMVSTYNVYVSVVTTSIADIRPLNNIANRLVDSQDLKDLDGDGVLNLNDAFPWDLAASTDTDGDGYPDDWNPGRTEADSTSEPRLKLDAFPEDSTEWSDTDGDGFGDNADAFPGDPTEWLDSDADGHGDNADAFPMDPTEWMDTDEDGYGDNADAFPVDPQEWLDSDGDGHGDNADAFPVDPQEWLDSDADGQGDNADAFPEDPTEWLDVDGDGHGDNSDDFPDDSSEWTDMDGDGVGNNGDRFPDDPSASRDSDEDGYPDDWNPGRTQEDSTSGLELDRYPLDNTRWMKEEREDETGSVSLGVAITILMLVAIPCILVVYYRIFNREFDGT